ncbi:MAG: hypothetical protein ACK55I_30200 [bacterium]
MAIIPVKITKQIFDEATNRNIKYKNKFGNIGTHRINKDRQRMTGYLAEACIRSLYPEIKYSDSDVVDFILNDITLDSKAQGCNSKPLDYFSATLYEEQKSRNTDYYIFSRVKNDFTIAWICGIISQSKFFDLAKFAPAGTQTNNFTYDQGRYEIPYKDLDNINTFIENIYENI